MPDKHTEMLNNYARLVKETSDRLKYLVDISMKHFQKQQDVNERILNKLDEISEQLTKLH